MKRTFNLKGGVTELLSTYYVYDDFGNLCFVLPPGASPDAGGVQSVLDELCYQYNYDGRHRLIEKKLPGKGWDFMIYNDLDQVTFTQDANQRAKPTQEWTYIQYDSFGRVAVTGIWNSAGASGSVGDTNISSPNRTLQQWLNGWQIAQTSLWLDRDNNASTGYTTHDPQGQILTINYYDDYLFPNRPYMPTTAIDGKPTGHLTANKTTILNPDGSYGPMLWNVHYYDDKGREVQLFKQHYLNGIGNYSTANYDENYTIYNFTGTIKSQYHRHYVAGNGTVVATTANDFYYDNRNRRFQNYEAVFSGNTSVPSVQISQLNYNEIGQLLSKNLHDNFQTINYSYNERGWLKNITTTNSSGVATNVFNLQLNYNENNSQQYNGNISSQVWNNDYQPQQVFTYAYDNVNRLVSGTSGIMSEGNIAYDQLGNITALTRDGNTISYNYYNSNKSNRLYNVSGGGLNTAVYQYDYNGNTIIDGSKNNIQISYNLLDLPAHVSGSQNVGFTYDATGDKLSKYNASTGLFTQYINGFQYDNSTGTQQINFVATEEGRAVRRNDGTFYYVYDVADHLGDVRTSFQKNPSTLQLDVVQADDYYPFGLRKALVFGNNKYLYNKKELQDELSQYDYGARIYDPVVGRWTTIDPLVEVGQESTTPYGYAYNDPIGNSDPDGKCPNCVTAAIGAGVGGLIGGVFEAGSQLYHSGKITSWKAVGGSALQGAVTGGVAGFTGGASLLATAGASAGANVIGGAANRLIQGKKITAGSVTTDAVTGALAGVGGKFLDKGIKVIGSRFTSSAASKAEAAVIKRELGNWVDESTTGWSKAAKEYQEQITGQPAGKAYLVKGTKFDGIAKDGTLLEAKSSYDNFVKKGTGQFYGWFKGAKSLVDQARRQLTDAAGKKIVWHIETKKTFDAIENLFEANGISGITLEYTPRVQ